MSASGGGTASGSTYSGSQPLGWRSRPGLWKQWKPGRSASAAGGVAVLAHPPTDADEPFFAELREYGLDGIEGSYPAAGPSVGERLRQIAGRLKLAVTGGSDCHGADPPGRAVGSRGLSRVE